MTAGAFHLGLERDQIGARWLSFFRAAKTAHHRGQKDGLGHAVSALISHVPRFSWRNEGVASRHFLAEPIFDLGAQLFNLVDVPFSAM